MKVLTVAAFNDMSRPMFFLCDREGKIVELDRLCHAVGIANTPHLLVILEFSELEIPPYIQRALADTDTSPLGRAYERLLTELVKEAVCDRG